MYQRRKYIKAMLEAIDDARTSVWTESHRTTRANGLRAIRTFERVNGIKFDPFNESHRQKTDGSGIHESFFRRAELLFKHNTEIGQSDEQK